ncbi:hypothetical protein DPMN_055217 [Dreissena polymorpha]|uniref:Uncharacterized protein n=1 Tax=Dreissena polymorpha TaxID=45954 RepID=A0A9D4HSB4_DREPO|nr:hypothetical protein DPMN_055217 [Dreissena polymorpha]
MLSRGRILVSLAQKKIQTSSGHQHLTIQGSSISSENNEPSTSFTDHDGNSVLLHDHDKHTIDTPLPFNHEQVSSNETAMDVDINNESMTNIANAIMESDSVLDTEYSFIATKLDINSNNKSMLSFQDTQLFDNYDTSEEFEDDVNPVQKIDDHEVHFIRDITSSDQLSETMSSNESVSILKAEKGTMIEQTQLNKTARDENIDSESENESSDDLDLTKDKDYQPESDCDTDTDNGHIVINVDDRATILQNEVDHEELVDNEQAVKRKRGNKRSEAKKQRMKGESYTGLTKDESGQCKLPVEKSG